MLIEEIMVNKETVLSFFREKTIKPLDFRNIVSLMKLSRAETRALKSILRVVGRVGDIVLTRKGLYGPAEDMDLVSGYFEQLKEGYGFVIMEKPGERDLFIPAWAISGAMNNDRVLVRIENRHKRVGRIIRILERAHTRIAGRFEVTKTGLYIRPKNRSLHFDLTIAQKDREGAKNGDILIAEIISYPTDRKPPAGKGVKIMGKPEDPKAEVEAIIDEFSLPRRFPRNVLDDAVSIKLVKHGYTLYVHIADVAFYIDWNSTIDVEARKRGTSVYFPDRVIPMLPKELSEDLCSLKPGVEKLAFTVEIDFDRNGNRLNAKFYPSVITSNERMTYTSVRKIFVNNDTHERKRYDYLLKDIELMGELCSILRNKRLERGSLDFDLPEPEVLLDIQGRPEAILKAERNYAHMIIEEFMVAANEAVAGHLNGIGIPILYRVHEEPDPLKFEDMVKMFKSVCGAKWPLKPKDTSELLNDIKGKPEEEVVNYMVLRSLKRARYSR